MRSPDQNNRYDICTFCFKKLTGIKKVASDEVYFIGRCELCKEKIDHTESLIYFLKKIRYSTISRMRYSYHFQCLKKIAGNKI